MCNLQTMNAIKVLTIVYLIFSVPSLAIAQSKIKWLTWEQAMEKNQVTKKKILVDIYTDWCGWCKKMDQTTYMDDKLAAYINENFYAIKFDAEQFEDITLNKKKYSFVKNGVRGYHQLAAHLLQGQMSYPSTVFLDENYQVIQAIPGFQDSFMLGMISTYFATNSHKNVPWQRYSENYDPIVMQKVKRKKD
jgi:uncharacterized protein YyaL (SSP411 family)